MRMLALMVLAVNLLVAVPQPAQAQEFTVIVNDANPNRAITTAELGRVFQKQAGRWSNGLVAEPVDLSENAALRERFSRAVFGRSTAQIKSWWQTQMFSGRSVPPAELTTEAQVIEYVLTHGGAIGYVSASATLPAGVRRLTVSR